MNVEPRDDTFHTLLQQVEEHMGKQFAQALEKSVDNIVDSIHLENYG